MLDKDLAALYNVTTGNLNKAVKRNLNRFPSDFMFQLTEEEFKNLIFQNGISSWGGVRKMPFAFTEHGVAMLSGILKSEIAIEVNLRIIRTFIQIRELLVSNKDMIQKLDQLEKQVEGNSSDIKNIFVALRQLLQNQIKNRTTVGFKIERKKED